MAVPIVLTRQKVRIVSGKSGVSSKTGKNYAILEHKNENGFVGTTFIDQPSDEIMKLAKELDQKMGSQITLVTSIEQ